MRRALVLTVTLFAGAAYAGDPCPIDFVFYDLGAPEWVDHQAVLDGLASKDSWVGITFRDAPGGGVLVSLVSSDGPAAKAGFQVQDVIKTVGGQPVVSRPALSDLFRATKPGATLEFTVTRAGAEVPIKLVMGQQDPLLGALIDYASKQECASVRRGEASPAMVTAARALAFEKNRRFRCDDAHKALAKADFGEEERLELGAIVAVRGSKRVLLSVPGWTTVCVDAAAFDGPKLAEPALAKLFSQLTARYVKDRHMNP